MHPVRICQKTLERLSQRLEFLRLEAILCLFQDLDCMFEGISQERLLGAIEDLAKVGVVFAMRLSPLQFEQFR